MSYVKNYNPGKITMDLPTANYIYELPLLSFGDTHGSMNLSLVFNSEMRADTSNPFRIAAGYKLNVQKRLIMTNGAPTAYQDANGKCVSLYGAGNIRTFDDNSQRILRFTNDTFQVEYPDFSREEYDPAGNIIATKDKYGHQVVSYTYNTGRMSRITYRESAPIILSYNSGNQLQSIIYSATGSRTNLLYYGTQIEVQHYSGTIYHLAYSTPEEPSEYAEFSAVATDDTTETQPQITHVASLTQSDSNTIKIIDYMNSQAVNTTTYVFPETVMSPEDSFARVDIINNDGVRTRTQYRCGELLYSYEVNGGEVAFVNDKYIGNVQIHKTVDDVFNSQAFGTLKGSDGFVLTPLYESGGITQYTFDRNAHLSSDAEGYYILTGWTKRKNGGDGKISIQGAQTQDSCEYEPDSDLDQQWKFFAYRFYSHLDAAAVPYVSLPNVEEMETKDFRILFQTTGVLSEDDKSHMMMFGSFLVNSEKEIPFTKAVFYYKTGNNYYAISNVTPSDVLRYKLMKAVYGCNEIYYDNSYGVITNAEEFLVEYGGVRTNIDALHVATKSFVQDKEFLNVTNVYAYETVMNMCVTSYIDNVEYAYQLYDAHLDPIRTNKDGLTTSYTRDAYGRIISESVKKTADNTVLYSRTTEYDDDNSVITTKDEFENSTVYTLDPVWGGVKSVTLPDGTVVTDEYDDDMCAMTKRIFGSATGRSNVFTYSGGNLSALQTGNLGYDFTYTAGKLTGISKNDTAIEEHVHADATAEAAANTASFYPSQNAPLHSTVARFDKYGRVSQIDGVLTNTYDVWPTFNETTGVMLPHEDNSSAVLAMTEDLVRGETARYSYDEENRLKKKTVTDAEDFTDKISEEAFTYDALNRLKTHTATYDVANAKSVGGVVNYVKEETDPSGDKTVASYAYKVNGVQKSLSANTYDDFKRLTSKSVSMSRSTFTKTVTYDKTRVTKLEEKLSNVDLGTSQYSYDEMGRIDSIIDSQSGSNTNFRTHVYDQYGQLVRENNKALDKSYVYVYNDIGNLTSVQAYPYSLTGLTGTPVTTTFGYTGDKLTSFGGATIAYNAMGCPTTYEGKTATWSKGRLSRLFKGTLATGTSNYAYNYNAYGQRVSKSYSYLAGTSGNNPVQAGQVTAYNKNFYYDHSGRLIAESGSKTYYGTGAESESIVYLYDENAIIGMEHTVGTATTRYYFQRNLLGDVVAIYNANGVLKAKYLYDAWGNCTISSETTDYVVANANPIRYRGYYYDDDTGLYYCNARYYSPKFRRFISPDSTSYLNPENINGLNLYCYCNNDPVNYADPSGYLGIAMTLLISVGVGLALGVGIEAAKQAYNGGDWNWDWSTWNWWEIGKAGLLGAANGLAYGLGGVAGGILKGAFHALAIGSKALTAYQSVGLLLGIAMTTNFAAGVGGYALHAAGSKTETFSCVKGISWGFAQTAKSGLSFFVAGMYVGVGGWNVGAGSQNTLTSIVGRSAGRFISSYTLNHIFDAFFI